ncbi:hypothetical protein GGR23_001590 [Gellertiella hungarica]|uniref:Uncharacterized protein n=1 Tax=Gellertiella hungarica TaxID=1572859 RepID=A0A7W6J5Q0_9HYPH|nr:hypothetical protein [Gellertiella hungarica]
MTSAGSIDQHFLRHKRQKQKKRIGLAVFPDWAITAEGTPAEAAWRNRRGCKISCIRPLSGDFQRLCDPLEQAQGCAATGEKSPGGCIPQRQAARGQHHRFAGRLHGRERPFRGQEKRVFG